MIYSFQKDKETKKTAERGIPMNNLEWKDKVTSFKKVDVRGIAGNFLDGLKTGHQTARWPRAGSHPNL